MGSGVDAIFARQNAHAFTDPPTEETLVGMTLSGATPARWKIGSTWREVRERGPGTIGISPSRETVELDVAEPHVLLVMAFSRDTIDAFEERACIDVRTALETAHCQYWHDHRSEALLRHLWDALGSTDRTAAILVDGLVDASLASLTTMVRGNDGFRTQTRNGIELAPLEDFVRAEIGRRTLSVADLAAVVDLPSRQFAEAFRVEHGFGPYEFVQRIRLEIACDLLVGSELTICQVASRLGFTDASHLGKFIKARTGRVPSTWRQ